MNNNIRNIFFLLIFSIFKNITKEINVGEGKHFIIDTGNERYVSKMDLSREDTKNEKFIMDLLQKEEFRENLLLFEGNTITDRKYSINKDVNYIFCSCYVTDKKKEGRYEDFLYDKYDENITKSIVNNNFEYNNTKFYYFFIINKEKLDKLYNIKFNKIEVFNQNVEFKKDNVNQNPVEYISKSSCNLKNYNTKIDLQNNIINSIKNDFNDFFHNFDNLKKELYFSKSVKILRILGCNYNDMSSIYNKITDAPKSDNSLSLYIDYKDEVDIILEFKCLDGYNLNIDEKDKIIHFNIKDDFEKSKDIENTKKESICDVINNLTVRKQIENKMFNINGKQKKLPNSCYKVVEDKLNFNKFIVELKIPSEDNNSDKEVLLNEFLTKIPPKTEEKVEKNCCGCEKNKKNKKK